MKLTIEVSDNDRQAVEDLIWDLDNANSVWLQDFGMSSVGDTIQVESMEVTD